MLRIRPSRLLGGGLTLLRQPCKKLCGNMSSGSTSDKKLRVLVDMDGVLADFEGGFLRKYRSRYPAEPYITLEERRGFWVSSQYQRLRSDLSVRHKETFILLFVFHSVLFHFKFHGHKPESPTVLFKTYFIKVYLNLIERSSSKKQKDSNISIIDHVLFRVFAEPQQPF